MTDLEDESSRGWCEKNSSTENSFSSNENEVAKCKRTSPRTVLDICEEDLNSEESSNSGDSCSTVTSLVGTETKKPARSPFHLLSSFFRKKNDKEKQQPLVRCFTYQEIANATRNFHNGTYICCGPLINIYYA